MVKLLDEVSSLIFSHYIALIYLQKVNHMIKHKLEERAKRPNDATTERGKGDLLDVLMDCQNEEGARLTHDELVAQTKT